MHGFCPAIGEERIKKVYPIIPLRCNSGHWFFMEWIYVKQIYTFRNKEWENERPASQSEIAEYLMRLHGKEWTDYL